MDAHDEHIFCKTFHVSGCTYPGCDVTAEGWRLKTLLRKAFIDHNRANHGDTTNDGERLLADDNCELCREIAAELGMDGYGPIADDEPDDGSFACEYCNLRHFPSSVPAGCRKAHNAGM